MPTERARREWHNRVQAEYRSSAIAARVVHLSIAMGLHESLVTVGLRIVGDELAHARLAHCCLVQLGGPDQPAALDLDALLPQDDGDGPLAALVDHIGRSFCLGETFAVPLFEAMRSQTRHPAVRPVMARVLQDEAVHRAFGWDMLDALLAIDPTGVRARIQAQLGAWTQGFAAAYARPTTAPLLTVPEREVGLLDLAEYARIHDHTLQHTIGPWFARRNISLPTPG